MSVQMRRLTVSVTALLFALTSLGATSAAQADAPAISLVPAVAPVIPAPPSKVLPVALDVKTPYEPQVSCDPRPKPGVTAFAALMTTRYLTGVTGTYRACLSDVSEHYDSRALDWMNSVNDPRQKAVADSVVAWLSAGNGVMARRFGISYIIWNKKIWGEYAPERGWAAYTGADPHTSHIHFSFSWDGAMGRTSWWSGKATTVVDLGPCQLYAGSFAPLYTAIRTTACSNSLPLPASPLSPYLVAVFGQQSPQIAVAQQALGVLADGQFGSATFVAVTGWQARVGVPVTGVLDKATWARLVPTAPVPAPNPAPKLAPKPTPPTSVVGHAAATSYTAYKKVVLRQGSKGKAVVLLQRALRLTADGSFGARTKAALVAYQGRQHLPRTGVTSRAVWDRFEARDYPLLRFHGLTLKQGSSGVPVAALERALRVGADGVFKASTGAAVKAVQSRARLAPTGVVSGVTWLAIDARMPH